MPHTLTRDMAIHRMPWLLTLTADHHDWPPWTQEQFLMELPEKWSLSVCSEHGVAILSRPVEGRVHLHLLAVDRDKRGHGHGSDLMAETKIRAGADRLTLKVPADSRAAVAFYCRHGFRFTPRWQPMELT